MKLSRRWQPKKALLCQAFLGGQPQSRRMRKKGVKLKKEAKEMQSGCSFWAHSLAPYLQATGLGSAGSGGAASGACTGERQGLSFHPPATSTTTSASAPAPWPSGERQIRKAMGALLPHSRSRKNTNGLLLNGKEILFVKWCGKFKEIIESQIVRPHSILSELTDIYLLAKKKSNVTPEKTGRAYKKLSNKHKLKPFSRLSHSDL